MTSREDTLAAVERIVAGDDDADDILRAAVAALGEVYDSVAIAFVEDGALAIGPTHGRRPDPEARTAVTVSFAGARVAELQVATATADDGAFLDRVAGLVAPYCLVGWDTGGIPWDDL